MSIRGGRGLLLSASVQLPVYHTVIQDVSGQFCVWVIVAAAEPS